MHEYHAYTTARELQVIVGFTLGHFAAAWAVRPAPAAPTAAQRAIAASVAQSAGAPGIAAALQPPPATAPPGMRALVQTACAFGNSLTLPLLFLLSLIPPGTEGVATGAIALFLLGWSPMFWTLGLRRLTSAADDMLEGRAGGAEQGGAGADGTPKPPGGGRAAAGAPAAPGSPGAPQRHHACLWVTAVVCAGDIEGAAAAPSIPLGDAAAAVYSSPSIPKALI